jgi:hypothetical protein
MSSELAVLGQSTQTALQPVGQGVNFGSKFLKLKPATINIVQPSSQAEGAIKGHLRIGETGDQFKEMWVALLAEPTEQRAWYTGEPGQLNRSAENLMCYCRNVVRDEFTSKELTGPDPKAKVPQAVLCASCSKADWSKYRQNKIKENIPPCDDYYHAMLIDTVFKMPLQLYVRSKSKAPFDAGMDNITRLLWKMKSQGKIPNIYDIKFKLSTKALTTGKNVSYILNLSDFDIITDEERIEFGEAFARNAARVAQMDGQAQAQIEAPPSQQVAQAEQAIDSAIVDAEYTDGEIITI